ncbi:MAG: alpha/beta hydrolase, partial [Rhizobium altiplani]
MTFKPDVSITRRDAMIAGSAVALALALPATAAEAATKQKPSTATEHKFMGTVKVKDGTEIFYKDWGPK